MMQFAYLATIVVFTFPFVAYGLSRRRFRKVLLIVAAVGIVIGAVWDNIATNLLKLWFFNPDTIVGLPQLLGLPLEEWLFFIFVSMAVATVTLKLQEKLMEKKG